MFWFLKILLYIYWVIFFLLQIIAIVTAPAEYKYDPLWKPTNKSPSRAGLIMHAQPHYAERNVIGCWGFVRWYDQEAAG